MLPDDIAKVWDALDRELVPLLTSYRAKIGELEVTTKADRTLLTEADVTIQRAVVELIRTHEPGATVVAEEQDTGVVSGNLRAEDIWIVDPIDGTAEFVKPHGKEFCSVVVYAPARTPAACWVLAPELGLERTPLTVRLDAPGGVVQVNGQPARLALSTGKTNAGSATRSRESLPRAFEAAAVDRGFELKLRTTSQTIDAIRTCLDIGPETGLTSFEFFYRERQKIWDGAVGLALATSTGRIGTDSRGNSLAPIPRSQIEASDPEFSTSVLAPSDDLASVLGLIRDGEASFD